MKKSKITKENIKTDLRAKLPKEYKYIAITSVFFLLELALIIGAFVGKFKAALGFTLIQAFIVEAVLLYLMIRKILVIKELLDALKTDNRIDEATLVSSQTKARTYKLEVVRRFRYFYILNFSKYDEYLIPDKNYTWSADFSTTDKGVYQLSSNGDEFYLVLSGSDKILYAYNKKFFELEK